MAYLNTFQVLADPTRCGVFEALCDAPQAVGELAAHFPVSRPAISQHLKVLKQAGLVVERPSGRRNIYAARRQGLHELRVWLDQFWDETLGRFDAYVDRQMQEL